jgi:hypothetical protein
MASIASLVMHQVATAGALFTCSAVCQRIVGQPQSDYGDSLLDLFETHASIYLLHNCNSFVAAKAVLGLGNEQWQAWTTLASTAILVSAKGMVGCYGLKNARYR